MLTKWSDVPLPSQRGEIGVTKAFVFCERDDSSSTIRIYASGDEPLFISSLIGRTNGGSIHKDYLRMRLEEVRVVRMNTLSMLSVS